MTGEYTISHPHPLIVIFGPTAIGKTSVAIEIANALNGEIVGADSRQIYQHMDIGTAKPTAEQQAQAKHHLIDLVPPDQTLSLAEYQAAAYGVIDALHAQQKVPLLVGGTGQYITALTEGWHIPRVPPNPELRAELEAYAASHGAEALYAQLQANDPHAAARIDYRNIRRVVRALEIFHATQQPSDDAHRKQAPPYRIYEFGLTLDRSVLYKRADQRIDEMLKAGFIDEVQRLMQMRYDRYLPAMSALGYREITAHLAGETTYDDAITMLKKTTRDFIRRQYTWFNNHDAQTTWIDVGQYDRSQLAQHIIQHILESK